MVLLREDAIDTLCALLYQLGSEYVIFIPMIDKVCCVRENKMVE